MTTPTPTNAVPPSSRMLIRRRTLLGLAVAAGVVGPMVTFGAGSARADSSSEDDPMGEGYEIPDGIGSIPWW